MSHSHSIKFLALTFVACLLSIATAEAADVNAVEAAVESITIKELRQHVNVLASDTFEGREAGTRGGKAAGAYLIDALKKLDVAPGGDSSFYQFFDADYRNVLAVIPGSDPVLKREFIIVSSHYDHVGYGSARNSYGPIGRIHNGADDNASGTAGLLEMIGAFASIKPAPRRSILFAFWDAEEKGLLGSEHWVSHPTVPLKQVKVMFNIDMIGRLRKNSLEMYGVRTAAGLRRLLCEQNRTTNLELDFNWDTKRDSDHYPFYARRIPYLMFHTRKHENYHRPSDDVDKLNLDGMWKVSRLMFRTVYAAADAAELPSFRPAALSENAGNRLSHLRRAQPKPARLGMEWDKQLARAGVIKVVSIRSGSAAARGGLRVGDKIIQFAGYDINGDDDFGLIVLAAGNPARIVVERAGNVEPIELKISLNGDPERIGISFANDQAEPGVVRITRVTPGSAAARAGLKPNHRIYEVGGQRFTSTNEFHKLVTTLPSPLNLLVEGRGQLREVQLKLLRQLDEADEPAVAEK
jgi:hypothetical protein